MKKLVYPAVASVFLLAAGCAKKPPEAHDVPPNALVNASYITLTPKQMEGIKKLNNLLTKVHTLSAEAERGNCGPLIDQQKAIGQDLPVTIPNEGGIISQVVARTELAHNRLMAAAAKCGLSFGSGQ